MSVIIRKLTHGSISFGQENNVRSSLFVSPHSDIVHIGMTNQLKLPNSVDICFGKSSDSVMNYC